MNPTDVNIEKSSGKLVLQGDITLSECQALAQKSDSLLDQLDEYIIDCSQISHFDHALLVLLLTWIAKAKSKNRSIKFLGIAAAVYTMANLSNLSRIIKSHT